MALKDVIDWLRVIGVQYVATCGTLLGALRHGGLIPWDYDIDLSLEMKDLNRVYNSLGIIYPKYTARYIVNGDSVLIQLLLN